MFDFTEYAKILGLDAEVDLRNVSLKELKKIFKRRSLAMLPEKHPNVPNAHSRFEEITQTFVQVFQMTEFVVLSKEQTSKS